MMWTPASGSVNFSFVIDSNRELECSRWQWMMLLLLIQQEACFWRDPRRSVLCCLITSEYALVFSATVFSFMKMVCAVLFYSRTEERDCICRILLRYFWRTKLQDGFSSSPCESANFNGLNTPALGRVCMVSCVLGFANINSLCC